MKARLFVLGVALTMLCASLLQSQTCSNKTVTATITDSDGTVWANGSYTVTATNPSGGQRPICRSTGQPITTNFSGNLNASGALSQSLPDTSLIDPAGMQWVFTIQSKTSALASVMLPINLTANISKTASFSSQVVAPRFVCDKTCFGYATSEVTSPVSGQVFTNISASPSAVCNLYNKTAWVACSSGASLPFTLTTLNSSGPASIAGTVLNIPQYCPSFSTDLTGNCTSQNVVGIEGNILPTLPTGGVQKFLTYDTLNGWVFQFYPLSGTDPPSAGLCTIANVGQAYVASGSLPHVGKQRYTCTAITGPLFVWVPDNSGQWGWVTPTNEPGSNSNWACVTNGSSNTCTWQSIAASSSPTVTAHPFIVEQSASSTTTVSSSVTVTAGQTVLLSFRNNGTAPSVVTFTDTLANTCTTRFTSAGTGSDNVTLGDCVIVNAGSDAFTVTTNTASSFRSIHGFVTTGVGSYQAGGLSSGGGPASLATFVTTQKSLIFLCNGSGNYPTSSPSIGGGIAPFWHQPNNSDNASAGSGNQRCALFLLPYATSLYGNLLPFYWSVSDGMAGTGYTY